MRVLAVVVITISVSGCAVYYAGNKFGSGMQGPEAICVVENTEVRAEFLQALRPLLEARKIAVSVVPSSAEKNACPFVLTYSATWHWDLKLYMREARMNLYKDGQPFADSSFLAPHGLINMSIESFDETETKLNKMLLQMGLAAPTT
jgi:hypothetical protein